MTTNDTGLPIFLLLNGRRALVLGTGEAAERRLATLRGQGAVVRHVARFGPDDAALLDGCAIAIGAEAPEDDLRAFHAAAMARGIPVNVVDRTAYCSFITPAVVARLPIAIAIGTGGAAPVLARLLRAKIETLVAPGYGRLAALVARFQDETRRRLPDVLRRRRMLEAALGGDVAALMLAGNDAAAERAYRDALDAAEAGLAQPETGIVYGVFSGNGEADLLTLRALRVLGEADVLVHAPDAPAAVLEVARRDASRLVVTAEAATETLLRLAEEGRKIVRLDPEPLEWQALLTAGIRGIAIPALGPDRVPIAPG